MFAQTYLAINKNNSSSSTGGGGATSIIYSHGGTGWEEVLHSLGVEAKMVQVWNSVSKQIITSPVDNNASNPLNYIRVWSDVALSMDISIVVETTATPAPAYQNFDITDPTQDTFICSISLSDYFRVVVDGLELMTGFTKAGNTVILTVPAYEGQKVRIYA